MKDVVAYYLTSFMIALFLVFQLTFLVAINQTEERQLNIWEPVVDSHFDFAIGETELPIDIPDPIVVVVEESLVPMNDAPIIGDFVGDRLTSRSGLYYGASGMESYYNLPMERCVEIMRELGYNDIDFPYWVREDGAKMLGEYVMVAADLETRPKGTILETSLGMGIVVDTGDFARTNPTQIDIATDW